MIITVWFPLKHRFRVSALNEVGESQPAEIDNAITMKDQIEAPNIELDTAMSGCINVRCGKTIKLHAKVSGRPEPTAQWLFADKPVEDKRIKSERYIWSVNLFCGCEASFLGLAFMVTVCSCGFLDSETIWIAQWN